jgi:tetratricopeptide (TPR) repeat protein
VLGQADQASEAVAALAEVGADIPQVNYVLVEFARSLDQERKRADAELIKATAAGDAKGVAEAKEKLAAAQQRLGELLKKLAARKQHTLSGTMAVADLCFNVGLSAEAAPLYRQILATPDVDAKAAARARAQLAGVLRTEGKYDEAYKEVRRLMDDNPRALEPQMELGRILMAWAEQDPRHYEEAAGQWIKVRNLLHPSPKHPPEYYEAVYNAAYCLHRQAAGGDINAAQKTKQAIQLLRATMVMNEKLSGPDMAAKYKALLEKLQPAGKK